MKRALLAVLLCAGLAACDAAQFQSPGAQANTDATRRYYASLVDGSWPNLSALTLFMTMLPKGGDLHHHYSGAIYVETFLDWVKAKNYCIRAFDSARGDKFTIEASAPKAGCLGADEVRDSGHNAFYRGLLSTWSDKDFYNHSQIQTAPDQHFFDTFNYFGPVSGADYGAGLRKLKARAVAENVQYIETMLGGMPRPNTNPALAAAIDQLPRDAGEAEAEAAFLPYCDWLAGNTRARADIAKYVAYLDMLARQIDDAGFKVRFQTYVVRGFDASAVFASLYSAFAAADAGGKVVGVNIVGPENGNVAMRDYDLHMRMFAFLRKKFPRVRLALHAGELTLGMVPPEGLQRHIREAVEVAGAQRIGHGVDIAYERDATGLLREMRERKVAVEVNLTSNEFILGVQGTAHPLPLYRHAGVPFVISTDDAGVSRNNLSGEYVLYASRYRPSYDELKETVFNSIRYSFLSDAEKAEELRDLTRRFAEFEARARDLARGLPGAGSGAPSGR